MNLDYEEISWKEWMSEYGIIEGDSDEDQCMALIDKNAGIIQEVSKHQSPLAVFEMFARLKKIDSSVRLDDFKPIVIIKANLIAEE